MVDISHFVPLTAADLYNEVFEIIDSCTFSAKSVSPTMWQAFELMHKTFKAGAELYLEGKWIAKTSSSPPETMGAMTKGRFGRKC